MSADGPVCIVTGASRGLGKAIALALGAEGCRVVVNHIFAPENATAIVKEIQALGGDGIAVHADITNEDGIKELFAATAAAYPDDPVGVLVNNAGITKDGLAVRMKPEQWNAVLNVNLHGTFFASQAAATVMMKARRGRIINIASVVGKIGNAGQANYAASKAAVIGLTMTLARECASRGVLVNAVAPGFISSDMTAQLPAEVVEEVTRSIPLERFGTAEEVAGLVKYLALDDSARYITGHTINIDGGIGIGTC